MTAHQPVSRETSGEEHGMVSNYPPGVTGNEPEIAGRPTRNTHRDCDSTSCAYTPLSTVEFWRDSLARQLETIRLAAGSTGETLARVDRTVLTLGAMWEDVRGGQAEFACDWGGEVEVAYRNGVEFWTCPRCGTDHEVEVTPDED